MTSVGVKIDNSITRQSGPYCFKIQGELYHLTGALLPHGDQTPIYAQIYILDTAEQLNVRRANNNNLDPIVMDNLQTMLLDSHPYIGQYRHAYELCHDLAKTAKSLSIFLFFSFLFILDLLHRRKCRKVSHHKCHTVTVT